MKNLFTFNRALLSLIAAFALLLAVQSMTAQDSTASQSTATQPAQSTTAQDATTAQESSSQQSTTTQSTTVPAAAAQPTAPVEIETPPDNPWYANTDGAYTVSLGTGALISLYPQVRNDQQIPSGEYADSGQPIMIQARDYRYQFFYGGSVNAVYTDSIGGITSGGNTDLVSTSINPYLAFFMPTKTGRYLVQYSGVINPGDSLTSDPQAYHTLTLSALGSFNERWFWTASASGSYGSESARLQAPLSFLVVSSTPIADTTSTAVLLRANNVAFLENKIGLGWLKSRRDRVLFSVFHNYTGIEGDNSTTPATAGSHTNSIGAKGEYIRSLTQRIDLRSYAEADTVLNGPKCNSYGVGAGLGVKMSHSVEFTIAGGPQWTTDTCGSPVSAAFSASLVKNFGNRDRIYAMVSRMFTTVATIDSRWEDSATVGFTKGLGRFTLTTDAGYLRGTSIATIVPAYHGYFIAPRLRYKIMSTLGLTGGYRTFHGTGGNLVSGNASYAFVGLEWYPRPLHFR